MSLIDQTFIKLPVSQTTDLQAAINEFEPKIIRLVFGYALAKLILSYSNSSEQRIKDIVNGKEYINTDGQTVKWFGLKSEEYPFIANYVTANYLTKKAHLIGNVGVSVQNIEGGQIVGVNAIVSKLWGEIKEYESELYDFMSINITDYPEFDLYKFRLMSVNQFGI